MSECNHVWTYVGLSTIGEPPVEHWACFRCRTLFQDRAEGVPLREYSEWRYGPWSWDEEEANAYAFRRLK